MQDILETWQAISVGNKTHKQNVVFDLNAFHLSCEDEIGHRGRDRMVIEFTTTCVISVYHH
jgi:hypothetical protein